MSYRCNRVKLSDDAENNTVITSAGSKIYLNHNCIKNLALFRIKSSKA